VFSTGVSASGMMVMGNSSVAPMEKCIIGVLHENSHLNLGSFVKSMSCYANVIMIDGKNKQKTK
jgi:hypothetical protein